MDGQLGADPAYGTCLQCAAIDRARLKTNPVTPRSDICSGCFKKYCYDPQNPPAEGQIVGRRFQFKDPDPFGLLSFYMAHKKQVIIGAVIVALGLIATITGCAMFWWRRFQRRKSRGVAYHQLSRGDGSEWSARMGRESHDMEPPRYSMLSPEKGKWNYSEAGQDMAKTPYAEASHDLEKTYYDEPGYGTEKLHHAEPGYETVTMHSPERSYDTATTQYAAPNYEPPKTQYAAPNHEPPKTHYAEPIYEPLKTQYTEPTYDSERRG